MRLESAKSASNGAIRWFPFKTFSFLSFFQAKARTPLIDALFIVGGIISGFAGIARHIPTGKGSVQENVMFAPKDLRRSDVMALRTLIGGRTGNMPQTLEGIIESARLWACPSSRNRVSVARGSQEGVHENVMCAKAY